MNDSALHPRHKKRLGELLRQHGRVDDLQLRAALSFHNKWGVPLGQVVVDMGFCTAQQVLEILAAQVGLPVVDLDAQPLEPGLAELLPVRVAESCRVVPLRMEGPRGSVLVVATTAPARPPILDEVARVTGKARVVMLLATDAAISRAIERLYYPHLLGAHHPVEPIPLPEADEHLPLVTNRAEYLMLAMQQAAAVPTVEHDGLPLMPPLSAELAPHALPTGLEPPRREAVPRPVAEAEPEVWIYGWGSQATTGLLKLLEDEGLRARVARTADVVRTSECAVVLTPLQSVEPVRRHRIRARLVVAGRVHERERAVTLGAHVFLSGPLRSDALIRTVREQVHEGRTSLGRVG